MKRQTRQPGAELGVLSLRIDLPQGRIGPGKIGLLEAIPHTQLSRRLEKEDRLLKQIFLGGNDQTIGGLNYIPKGRLTKREYLQRYSLLVNELFEPKSYFQRILPTLLSIDRKNAAWGQDKLQRTLTSIPTLVDRFRSAMGEGEAFRLFQRVLTEVSEKNPAALQALREGDLHVVVDEVLPLDEVNDGFRRLVERRVQGNLLLALQ